MRSTELNELDPTVELPPPKYPVLVIEPVPLTEGDGEIHTSDDTGQRFAFVFLNASDSENIPLELAISYVCKYGLSEYFQYSNLLYLSNI